MGWQQLLREHGPAFLAWLQERDVLHKSTECVAASLSQILMDRIRTPEDARHTWQAVPAVLGKCNDSKTYGLPFAAEAYAWLHLVSRFVRSWNSLVELVRAACLPLGLHGVRVLDVGTGPGPTVLATSLFYRWLTNFAKWRKLKKLEQVASITSVERNDETNMVFSHLAEYMEDHFGMSAHYDDFREINFAEMRDLVQYRLLNQTFFNELLRMEDLVYLPQEAHNKAQAEHRYRFVVFSNFLTTPGIVQDFRDVLSPLLIDMKPGGTVLVIGGTGADYPTIYSLVDDLARDAGFETIIERTEVSDGVQTAEIGFQQGKTVFRHVQQHYPAEDTFGLVDERGRQLIQHVTDYYRSDAPRCLSSSIVCYRKPGTNG